MTAAFKKTGDRVCEYVAPVFRTVTFAILPDFFTVHSVLINRIIGREQNSKSIDNKIQMIYNYEIARRLNSRTGGAFKWKQRKIY